MDKSEEIRLGSGGDAGRQEKGRIHDESHVPKLKVWVVSGGMH